MSTPVSTYEDAMSLVDADPKTRRALDIGSPARVQPMPLPNERLAASQLPITTPSDQAAARRTQETESNFIQRNTDPDVPLDTTSGMDAGMRAKLSFERDPGRRAQWLAQQPGIHSARLADDGQNIIARVQSKDGQPRDIMVNERGFTLRDLADLSGHAPEAAASLTAAFLTGGMSLLPQAAATGIATAGVGAISDATARAVRGADVSPGEIAVERGTEALTNTVIPLVPAGAKRGLQLAVGPFAKFAGPLEREGAAAADRLGVSLSAGQRTGAPILARAESFSSKIPGGGALVDQAAAQEEAIRRVQETMLGGPPSSVPGEADIASRVSKTLATRKTAEQTAIDAERDFAAKQAQSNMNGLVDARTLMGDVTASDAGNAIRSRMVGLRNDFRTASQKLYDAVYTAAGGKDVTVPTTAMKQLVAGIQGDTSAAAQSLVPEIKRVLNIGDKLPNALPLNQARELRSLISDQIGSGQPIGNIPDRYLIKLRDALTKSIDDGVAAAKDPNLKTALAAANQHYRDNVGSFSERGIGDLFAPAAHPGGVDDSQIVRRVFNGEGNPDLLKRYGQMLGQTSNEYRMLVKAGLKRMIDDSTPLGDNFVDAGSFLSRLRSLDPEMRKAMLGGAEKDLVANAQLVGAARNAKLDVADIEKVLQAAPGTASSVLRGAIGKQQVLDRLYKSKLMGALTDGQFNPSQLNPDEFVSRFVTNASVDETRNVLTRLRMAPGGTQLVEDIRRRTLANLLSSAGRSTVPEDAVASRMGNLDYTKLLSSLRENGDKFHAILGKDTMATLSDLAKVEALRAKSAKSAGQAGQLVTSNVLASFLDFNLSEVPRIIKNRIISAGLTAPGFKNWMGSGMVIPATPKARMAVMASPPMVRALMNEFRNEPDKLGQVLDAVRSSPDAKASNVDARRYEDALNLVK